MAHAIPPCDLLNDHARWIGVPFLETSSLQKRFQVTSIPQVMIPVAVLNFMGQHPTSYIYIYIYISALTTCRRKRTAYLVPGPMGVIPLSPKPLKCWQCDSSVMFKECGMYSCWALLGEHCLYVWGVAWLFAGTVRNLPQCGTSACHTCKAYLFIAMAAAKTLT